MDATQQKGDNKSDTLHARYYWVISCYVFALLLMIFNYSIRSTVFVGIVLGSIFPFISFLYLHKNYISEKKKIPPDKIQGISVLGWALPAFFLHVIIIFGFNITISGPMDSGFKRSLYSSFYKYSKIFEKFTEQENNVTNVTEISSENLKKLNNYVALYASFFEERKREKRQTRVEQFLSWMSDSKEEKSRNDNTSTLDDKEASGSPDDTQGLPSKEESIELIQQISNISERIGRIPFFIAITFGFLGALIFCLSDAINRYNNIDLYPKVYIFYIIRFIISASLAVALSSFIMTEFPVMLVPIIFFGIGYFPERAIKYIDDKMTQYFGMKSTEYKPIPLSLIQGLSPEKGLRLREIGIEDVQHLALADIAFLEKNLPYNPEMLCDWIAQSVLYLQFPDYVDLLRKMGIRTILQLRDFELDSPQVQKQIVNQNISKRDLDGIEYLKYMVSLPHFNDRICRLMDAVKTDREEYRKARGDYAQ